MNLSQVQSENSVLSYAVLRKGINCRTTGRRRGNFGYAQVWMMVSHCFWLSAMSRTISSLHGIKHFSISLIITLPMMTRQLSSSDHNGKLLTHHIQQSECVQHDFNILFVEIQRIPTKDTSRPIKCDKLSVFSTFPETQPDSMYRGVVASGMVHCV